VGSTPEKPAAGDRVPTTLEEALAENAQLRELNRQLMARLEELERRVRQNSQNSSRPPSSDPPGIDRPKKKGSGRKPGGQRGHKGHRRELLAPERVDETHDVWPERCERCQDTLPRAGRAEVGEPDRHQVSEIPPLRAHVAEFRLHTQCCPSCDWATTASLPEGVPKGAFGPRLQAIVAACSGVYHMSKRMVAGALSDLFGIPISTGSVIACEQRVSDAIAPAVEEAQAHLQRQAVVHADETGWQQGRERAWLWVAATALVAVFIIHARRSAAAMKELLGHFAGVLVSDRWAPYEDHPGKRQLCWAHLKRHWEEFTACSGALGEIGQDLLKKTRSLFRSWHRVRDGTLSRAAFKTKTEPLRGQIEMLLLAGAECAQKKQSGMCREIWRLRAHLWSFIDMNGVEPTNNAAERALRPAVLYRKGCFGTHSERGGKFVGRMLTVATTLHLQQRNVIDYLVESCERALQGRRPFSICPGRERALALPVQAAAA
jgi:transposase